MSWPSFDTGSHLEFATTAIWIQVPKQQTDGTFVIVVRTVDLTATAILNGYLWIQLTKVKRYQ